MPIEIGIVGAGNRGQKHAEEYGALEEADVVAVADVDEEAATTLASEVGASVYGDYRELLEDASLDAVSVCVHNNLHRPVTVDAADAGCHVFCEKPMAATYADAKAMADACEAAGVHLGVQNVELFTPETQAARRLIDQGELGEPYFARGVFSRRRGRPFVDGYGTPSFVRTDAAGGGPVIDVGTYVVGQLLYLLGNAPVERVVGRTFEHTAETYDPSLVGEDRSVYAERLEQSGYDVEDVGLGFAQLEDGSTLGLRAAWHQFLPAEASVVAGTRGGLRLDPFEYYTTTADYEATATVDLEGYERRQRLLESEDGYDDADDGDPQFAHWIGTLTGSVEEPIPTGDLALSSTLLMEGIYRSEDAGRELTAAEIAERSAGADD